MKSTNVLVIDDDHDIREAITQVLEYEGYAVVTAKNGEEGLKQLESKTPHVIILDLMMPVMNGWQFKAEVDRRPELSGIPIVVLSADANVREKSTRLGVSEYLSKPIELDTLLHVVRKHLRPQLKPNSFSFL